MGLLEGGFFRTVLGGGEADWSVEGAGQVGCGIVRGPGAAGTILR
jgi:hypothetical protein